jgi:hypothetical protein
MNRHQSYKMAAIGAAAILIGGACELLRAQTSPSNAPRAPATAVAPPGAVVRQAPNVAGWQNYFNNNGTGNWSYSVPNVENDPEMAKLAESESELAHHADELLSQFVAAEKADDQKRLKSELRDMLAKQFDVQRQRRELELSRIEERVKKLRDQIKKRNDARETIIDRRLEQLTNEAEGLGWGQPAGAVTIPQPRAIYKTEALAR